VAGGATAKPSGGKMSAQVRSIFQYEASLFDREDRRWGRGRPLLCGDRTIRSFGLPEPFAIRRQAPEHPLFGLCLPGVERGCTCCRPRRRRAAGWSVTCLHQRARTEQNVPKASNLLSPSPERS
jgi:hypothetical protein